MKFTITFLALLSLVSQATASGVFIQCADGGNLVSNLLDTVGTLLGNVLLGACQTGCANAGYDYSLWSPSLSLLGINLLNMCYCANSDSWNPTAENAKPADSGTTCAKGGLIGLGLLKPDWTVSWHTSGSWQHQSCLSGASLVGGPTFGVSSTNECFTECNRYKFAAMTYTGASTIGCTCGTFLTGGTPVACGVAGTWSNAEAPVARRGLDSGGAIIFANSAAEISAIGQTRRALEARLHAQAVARDHAYCPRGLTGCAVPGSSQYECINTQTELESCGGCANGYFGANATAADGVDCTAIRGVAVGGVSCVSGQCEVISCRRNWQLVDGQCVRSASRR